jgi:CheY-like chemotaxis protein
VLSTLHTDDAFGAIVRLLDLGVDRSLISTSLSLIVAQRLARRVCLQCREAYAPAPEVIQKLRVEDPGQVFYRGKGCQACRKAGYTGRLGIYEMLRITTSMKELIRQKATESALRRAAAVAGSKTLLEDGIIKACQGETNPDELFRVIEIVADESFPCPKCGSVVNREFKSCPYCAFTLRKTCQACGQDLNQEGALCPYCSTAMTVEAVVDANRKPPEPVQHLLPPSSTPVNERKPPAAQLPAPKLPKIVIADDDENILKVVAAALRQLPIDVEVFTASDGNQALQVIESMGADLAILDLKMPGMDGFAVCDQLRKDIRTAFLPILMLTANSDQENRTQGYLVGTDDFMSKPFAIPEFLARVTRLLRRTYGV